jgi:hypothetical protein
MSETNLQSNLSIVNERESVESWSVGLLKDGGKQPMGSHHEPKDKNSYESRDPDAN